MISFIKNNNKAVMKIKDQNNKSNTNKKFLGIFKTLIQ